MTEEVKDEKHCCYYVSDGYKRFLMTILGSFVGCLIALCLYNASVGAPSPQPCYCPRYDVVEFDEYVDECPEMEHKKFEGEHKKFEHKKPPVKSGK